MSNVPTTIPVWVNAGDQAVTFTRCDRAEWEKSLFVNVPTGVREAVVRKLRKVVNPKTGKLTATRNIRWEMPKSALIEQTIQSGPHMGDTCWAVKIQREPSIPGAVALAEWVKALEVTDRGAVDPEVQSIMDEWLAEDGEDGSDPF